jgi:uncharacterized protein YjiS (DUF1127 family)
MHFGWLAPPTAPIFEPQRDRLERHTATRSVSNLPMSFLHRFITLVQTWRQRLRDRQQLAEMDDRSLRDIGLTRYDAELELGKPFWRE